MQPRAALVDGWGRVHGLGRRTLVGRAVERVDLVVQDDTVSLVHAEVSFDTENGWFIADVQSTNGTFVDGKRIDGEVALWDQQIVVFGDVSFLFIERTSSSSWP